MPDQHFFQKVCRYGAEYRDWLLLNNPPTDVLLNDWWQAYQFFLGRAFYQGRSDIVSGMVHERALEVLKSEEFFGENPDEARYLKLKEQNWQTLEKALQEKI